MCMNVAVSECLHSCGGYRSSLQSLPVPGVHWVTRLSGHWTPGTCLLSHHSARVADMFCCAKLLRGNCGSELRSSHLRGSKHFTEPFTHPVFYFIIAKIPTAFTTMCLTYSILKTDSAFVYWSCLDQRCVWCLNICVSSRLYSEILASKS